MRVRRKLVSSLVLISAGVFGFENVVQAAPVIHRLPGHTVPSSVTRGARAVQEENPQIPLTVRLKLRNLSDLAGLLEHLYTPGDPMYGQYIGPDEFMNRFGATAEEQDQVINYFHALGCSIPIPLAAPQLAVSMTCAQTALEQTLGIKISHWMTPNHEPLQTIDMDPNVPDALSIQAIVGLTSVPRHPHYEKYDQAHGIPLSGSGPNGGLAPSDFKTAYNLKSISATGSGQTLGLFELDGYVASDIAAYDTNFGISPQVPLTNILIDGFNGSAGSGQPEVTLDIELMSAMAPGAKQILVYEGPNTDPGLIDVYQRIATDNLAKQVSTSWGEPEDQSARSTLESENRIFMQMAVQGQSIYAASGDAGAFDDGVSLSVDDPASQPYITGAGGTTLTTNADHTYASETVWWDGKDGSGGGVSSIWELLNWQSGVANASNLGSSTRRNVPDVALNADPQTGYAVYVAGSWGVYGGTSCAAPLWASFTALVNEQRVSTSAAVLGFASPAIYSVGKSSAYALDFHDIANGSTNGHYPAVVDFDLSTGWGTFNGANLFSELSTITPAPTPSETFTPVPSPTPSPTPTPPPSGGGGCSRTPKQQTGTEQTGAALSMGLPFVVGYVTAKRKKK